MKNLITILAIATILFSCNSEPKSKKAPLKQVPLKERPIPPLPGAGAAASNTVIGGAHYICPKNCVGGNGPAAGACPVCQTEMAHNQGFHVGPNSNAPAPGSNPLNPAASTGDLPNANGQYHYTCTKGCTGGAGKAGNCSQCSSPLAHNAAYHS